jgi:hypothetical protein
VVEFALFGSDKIPIEGGSHSPSLNKPENNLEADSVQTADEPSFSSQKAEQEPGQGRLERGCSENGLSLEVWHLLEMAKEKQPITPKVS